MRDRRRKALEVRSVRSSVSTWVRALPDSRDDDRTMGMVCTASGKFVPAVRTNRPMLPEACALDGTDELFQKGVRANGSGPRTVTRLEKFAALRRAIQGDV